MRGQPLDLQITISQPILTFDLRNASLNLNSCYNAIRNLVQAKFPTVPKQPREYYSNNPYFVNITRITHELEHIQN